jgi:hypothetical protein
MLTLVALLLAHASVTEPPFTTVDCDALNVTVGPAGAAATVTVAEEVAVPPEPVAVNAYVVVFSGVTETEPESGSAVELTLGEIVTESALLLFHVSITDCPAVIWLLAACRLAVGGGSPAEGVELPPEPHPLTSITPAIHSNASRAARQKTSAQT